MSNDDLEPGLRHRLVESNIAERDWAKVGPIIQAACEHNNVRPIDLDAWTSGYVYDLPDGSKQRTTDYVIGVLDRKALILAREKGLVSKKMDFKAIELDNLGAARFRADDKEFGAWGTCDLQAWSAGGQAIFRLGWGWSGRANFGRAMAERDRIAALLPP